MANIPENLFHMDANEIKEPIKAERINKQPKPKAIPDCKIIVNPHSLLFDPVQIGIKEDPTLFKFRDNLYDLRNAPHQNLDNMFIQRYEVAPDNVVLRLISFKVPVAQVSSKGNIEVFGGRISTTTTQHINRFISAVGGQNFTFPSLVKCYGVNQLTPIAAKPVVFPRVTIGMLNKGIKATQPKESYQYSGCDIKVDSKTNKVIRILPNNGAPVVIYASTNLRDAMVYLVKNGVLNYNYILEANKPENIMKFYRS